MTYITVPNTFNPGETCSAASMNSNFAALQAGLGDGSKEINLANATVNAATLASMCTAVNMVSNYSMTVGGEVQGDRVTVRYGGGATVLAASNANFIPKIVVNGTVIYSSTVNDEGTQSITFSRGSYPFSAGDKLGVHISASSTTYPSQCLRAGGLAVIDNNTTTVPVGYATMPRSGSVLSITWFSYNGGAWPAFAYYTRALLEVVFDN